MEDESKNKQKKKNEIFSEEAEDWDPSSAAETWISRISFKIR